MAGGDLQREIKKRRPFEAPEEEVILNLARTNDQVAIRFARLFREHGLTPAQYNVLRILRGEGGPLPILQIAGRCIAIVPGITGLIDRLEALGLVCRERCTKDRRVVYVAATAKGIDLVDRLDEPVLELNRKLIGHLSREELRELTRLLEKACAPLVEDPGD